MTSSIPRSKQAGLHLSLVLMTTMVTSAAFYLNPSIDMAVSRYFFDGEQFPLRHNGFLQALRQANFWAGVVVIGVSMALIASRRLRDAAGINFGRAVIPLVTYGMGVGLIVNMFLKDTFGRARPRDTIGLGGDQPLTAAWEMSQACPSNCSFTSGEAAGAMAMMSLVYLIPIGWNVTRRVVQILLASLAISLSFNRILFGGHYLSDVVLSMLIVTAVMFAAEWLLRQIRWEKLDPNRGRRGSSRRGNATDIAYPRTQ
ncbi:phosphatase PAP2 family protein [Aliirhizobium smilacinae]|uniref:Phosphatase PAP2 family protein n=1 Tax=Aliirhizobium smilacinae TaxID=1395944 RepID=A0A5C4XFL5_9HYPH|nr:phosphatase PAP2 family protein [Rhizobium smilacinae]TNM61631.1 phosphatase PAP2 family protein [Rhizobium smilacinae]